MFFNDPFFSIYIDMDVDVGIDIDYPEGSRLAFLFLGKLEQFSLTIYTLKGVFSQLIALTAFQPLFSCQSSSADRLKVGTSNLQ